MSASHFHWFNDVMLLGEQPCLYLINVEDTLTQTAGMLGVMAEIRCVYVCLCVCVRACVFICLLILKCVCVCVCVMLSARYIYYSCYQRNVSKDDTTSENWSDMPTSAMT